MEKPLISIIIPTFNRAHLIQETLNSVIAQLYSHWECIVVDDGSRDNTKQVVEGYAKKDERFKYFQRPLDRKKGASSSRNYGLEMAKGDYIQFLDSDDLLNERKFEEQLKVLRKSPPQSLVTCRWGSFNVSSNLRIKTKYHSYRSFSKSVNLLSSFGRYDEYFPPLVYLVPRELLQKAGKWNEIISHNDDGEYFTRVIINSPRIIFCEKAEVYYRAGDENRLSILDQPQKVRSALESWKMIENHLHRYPEVSRLYVGNGVSSIKERMGGTYPQILQEYRDFLEKDRTSKKWYHKILGR